MKKISARQKLILIFSGILITILVLEAGLRLGGFIYLSFQEYRNVKSIKKRGEYRILCLGESTTQSQWPQPLEKILAQKNTGVNISVIDKGTVGTNTGIILARLGSYIDKYRPDMIIAMIGINDEPNAIALPVTPIYSKKNIKSLIKSSRIYKLLKLFKIKFMRNINGPVLSKNESDNEDVQRSIHSVNDRDLHDIISGKITKEKINDAALCLRLGEYYLNKNDVEKAEEWYERALLIEPFNIKQHILLGSYLKDIGENDRAIELFNRMLSIDPYYYQVYWELGFTYQNMGELNKAIALYKLAISKGAEEGTAFKQLGECYCRKKEYDKAVKWYKKAISINPLDDELYALLGQQYRDLKKYEDAIEAQKKAISLNKHNIEAYIELGHIYRIQGMHKEVEDIARKAISSNPDNEEIIHELYFNKQQTENNQVIKENVVFEYYLPITVENYRKIREISAKRDIQLVCVQYPTLKIEPLKELFINTDGIIFVDNEHSFKNAIKNNKYEEYFVDNFAENFGHCTKKGNWLLANNISDVLLKEVFNK